MRCKFLNGEVGKFLPAGFLFVLVFSIPAAAQLCVTPVRSFGFPHRSGEYPVGGVILASDGYLYGTTVYGGSNTYGAVFRMNTDGAGYTVIRSLAATATDGRQPWAGVIEGADGFLYGTTWQGGISNVGTIFKLSRNGGGYQVLHHFTGTNGASPEAPLIQASDGRLYGTAPAGGMHDQGAIFCIETNGANFHVIRHFGAIPDDGANPADSVIEASDGRLYTTTLNGGAANNGAVVGVDKSGANYAVILSFAGGSGSGRWPLATVMEGSDGVLYGTTSYGSVSDRGTIFRVNKDGTGYLIMWHLGLVSGNLQRPRAQLMEAANGLLYGTTREGGGFGRGAIFSVDRSAPAFAVVHSFLPLSNGEGAANPVAPLIEGPDGTFYGTTERGGLEDRGTIFKYTRSGNTYATLHSQSFTGGDGYIAYGPPTLGPDGFLYGTCSFGGSNNAGIVFRCDAKGNFYSVLHHFRADPTDGWNPEGGLLAGSDSRLYGTCRRGGGVVNGIIRDQGTLYRIQTNGSGYTILHRFGAARDGRQPIGDLLEADDGLLYGTTAFGGTNDSGSIFRIEKSGAGYTLLYSFRPSPDAQRPTGGLTAGPDGRLYGATEIGGDHGRGTVFALNRDGSGYVILKHFGAPGDIAVPRSPLLLASNLALYGVTAVGSAAGTAAIFRINTDGSGYAALHSFPFLPSGAGNPFPSLVEGAASDGGIYGIDETGGAANLGIVYRFNPDGSNFQIVREFKAGDPGGNFPRAGLRRFGETFYGITFKGGEFGAGTIYRLAASRSPALSLSPTAAAPGSLAVRGPHGCSCQIQYAETLAPSSWQNLTNLNLTIAPSTFVDSAATNSARFYRALLTP
jgi:uncharacterized repeat protein (TIGR03803 family)